MSTTNTEQVQGLIKTLNDTLASVRAEREQFESEIEDRRKRFQFREQMIEQAAQGLEMAFATIDFSPDQQPVPATNGTDDLRLSVGEDHIKTISDYLSEHGSARQSDITNDLKLNSGTVSVALRRLEIEGKIEKGDKMRGSRVWIHKTPTPSRRKRETVVRPGEGAASGRKKVSA